MHLPRGSAVAATVVAMFFTRHCAGQDPEMTQGAYTDPATGIDFTTWSANPDSDGDGAFTFGLALPEDAATRDATEYIGLLRCQIKSPDHTGWCGIAHGGSMVQDLLLMAWPYNNDSVLTSFRWATDYFPPDPYAGAGAGSTVVDQISSWVNDTGYELIYRCRGCLSWEQDGEEGAANTTAGRLFLGHAQSFDAPGNAGCPAEMVVGFHDNGYGQWMASLEGVAREEYEEWAALATQTVVDDCAAGAATATVTAAAG